MSGVSPMEIAALLLGIVGAFAVFIKGIKKCKCGSLFVIERYNTEQTAMTSIRTSRQSMPIEQPNITHSIYDERRKAIRFTSDNPTKLPRGITNTETLDVPVITTRKRRRSLSPHRIDNIQYQMAKPRRTSSFTSVGHTRSKSDISSISSISTSPSIPENDRRTTTNGKTQFIVKNK